MTYSTTGLLRYLRVFKGRDRPVLDRIRPNRPAILIEQVGRVGRAHSGVDHFGPVARFVQGVTDAVGLGKVEALPHFYTNAESLMH